MLIPENCGRCKYITKYEITERSKAFICSHKEAFDAESNPLFVMKDEAPPEKYCPLLLSKKSSIWQKIVSFFSKHKQSEEPKK